MGEKLLYTCSIPPRGEKNYYIVGFQGGGGATMGETLLYNTGIVFALLYRQ